MTRTLDVVVPGSPAYETLRAPAIANFADARPAAVVRCRTPADVAAALEVARRGGLPVAVRSGGHCFAGRSSTDGIVVDVGPMRSVVVGEGVATIGAGARLGDVYDALAEHGLTIAAGCGPAVGVAGLTLGGGLGVLGRRHGLTCDQLVATEVVLADGRIVACDERREPDLFWALRGAGGGQFGIVTSLAMRTVPAPPATSLHLTWPAGDAVAVADAWASWAPDGPDELAASLLVTAAAERPPVVHVFGAMAGSAAQTASLLDELVARARAEPASSGLRHGSHRATKRHLAEHGPGDETPPGGHLRCASEFFRRALPREAIAGLVEHLGRRPAGAHAASLDLSPWGGAYNRVPVGATAIPHRRERFLLKHEVVADPAATPAARDWLRRSWALAHPWGAGGAYVNFPDPDLPDADRAYHGKNLERLRRVKAAYDPDDVFGFPQGLGNATSR